MKTAIVTDTNSGIFPEEAQELGVFVLPMPVLIDGETYYEGENLSIQQFYRLLTNGAAVFTSQPGPGYILPLWDRILEEYDELVYIPMSSGLSSSCETAQGLAREYGGRVQVADNHRISLSQKSAVLDAKALADAGCGAAEIRRELERTAYDSMIYIGVETLEYLKKSGRVTAAGAALGTVLNLRPLLKIEGGKLDARARVRGTDSCKKRLLSEIEKSLEDFLTKGWTVDVAVADSYPDPAFSGKWLAMAKETLDCGELGYSPLTCSIGSHVGPNAFSMAISRRLV